jgi:hypothetical protein
VRATVLVANHGLIHLLDPVEELVHRWSIHSLHAWRSGVSDSTSVKCKLWPTQLFTSPRTEIRPSRKANEVHGLRNLGRYPIY